MRNLFPYTFRRGRSYPEELDWDYLLKVQAEKEQIRRRMLQEAERAEKERREPEPASQAAPSRPREQGRPKKAAFIFNLEN